MRKSRSLKEWELARYLFEQTSNAEQRAWIRTVEADYIRMEAELARIYEVKLANCDNNLKLFVDKLLQACKVSEDDHNAIVR